MERQARHAMELVNPAANGRDDFRGTTLRLEQALYRFIAMTTAVSADLHRFAATTPRSVEQYFYRVNLGCFAVDDFSTQGHI